MRYGGGSRLLTFLAAVASLSVRAAEPEAFIAQAGIPGGLRAEGRVVVAIVDDGLRMDHEEIRPFLWRNPREVPGNGFDDDGNGRVDDVYGWDAGDLDADPAPPAANRGEFFHGTHLAGILAQIGRHAYGEAAPRHLRILPVKSLRDDSRRKQLTHAFRGIAYAIDAGADIILCAWGVHAIAEAEKAVLERARHAGILIVAAGGNIPGEREAFPAAHPAALAVSGHDFLGRKLPRATYGEFVDLTAPAEDIRAASSTGTTTDRAVHSGSSQAAAIVAGAAAILKLQRPAATPADIRAALLNAATVTTQNPAYRYKLGAGKLNLRRALRNGVEPAATIRLQSKGVLPVDLSREGEWSLGPFDRIEGFRLRPLSAAGSPASGEVEVVSSGGGDPATRNWPLRELPEEMLLPGEKLILRYRPGETPAAGELLFGFSVLPVDQSTLYCDGRESIVAEGILSDGSGEAPYSPDTSCFWHITAPEGKVVRIEFLALDTELPADKVYFFNGRGTYEPIMAIYTGSQLPKPLTTWSNEVLVWFVTDGRRQKQGWEFAVTFVDAPAAAASSPPSP